MTDLDHPKIIKSGAFYSETLGEYIPVDAELIAPSEASNIPDIRLHGHVKVADEKTIYTLQDVPLTSPLLGEHVTILSIGEVVMRGQVSWVFRYVVSNEILTDPKLSKENIRIDSYFTNLEIRAFLLRERVAGLVTKLPGMDKEEGYCQLEIKTNT